VNRSINIYAARAGLTPREVVSLFGGACFPATLNGPGHTDLLSGEHVSTITFLGVGADRASFKRWLHQFAVYRQLVTRHAIKNHGEP